MTSEGWNFGWRGSFALKRSAAARPVHVDRHVRVCPVVHRCVR